MLSIQLVTRVGTKIAYSCLTAELQNIATQKLPMNRKSLLLVTCATVLIAAVVPVQAGPILQPAAATASSQFSGVFGDPANAISQSGLSVGYRSLVTDFDTYIASNSTHIGSTASFVWFARFGAPFPITFDFDLGGTFLIESFAMWGDNQSLPTKQYVNAFELLADDNPAFSSPTSLGSFNYTNVGTGPEVFTFATTSAAHVRMVIRSNHGSNNRGFGEGAFEVTDVLEPTTLALFSLGLVGAGLARRRKRTSLIPKIAVSD